MRDTTYYMLAYAAYITPQIAFSVVDVDNANKWGFAHEAGPFEIWDMLGVAETAAAMEAAGCEVAPWVKEMLAAGTRLLLSTMAATTTLPQKPTPNGWWIRNRSTSPACIAAGKEVARNDGASLHDMGDGVALLEFHAKMNAIDADIVAMANTALERLDSDFDALVIGNNGQDFCVGANIAMIGIAAAQGMYEQIDQTVRALQQATYDLRHAPKPVVTAPHGACWAAAWSLPWPAGPPWPTTKPTWGWSRSVWA